ncbi:hypothetical protein IWQ49_000367 [Labrenzia sp. EL_126]|nr:hypothetical protein [Labrenzia sp. EL_126]
MRVLNCSARFMAILLLVFLAFHHTSLPVQSKEVAKSHWMERGEFHARFHDNLDLKKHEFDIFPERLKHHLRIKQDWRSQDIKAFSKKVGRWSYLVVVTDGNSTSLGSRGALMRWRGGSGTLRDRFDWKPLNLPSFQYMEGGWSVVVGETHFLLEWNEQHNGVQSTYCNDVPTHGCIRHTTIVGWSEQKLILIEYYPASRPGWTPVWKSGRWLVDPGIENFGFN